MKVSCIDPNGWTDGDKFVAEIDEDVDAGPMEESVLGMLVTAIDKSKNKTWYVVQYFLCVQFR
jgi:hypothetical protein